MTKSQYTKLAITFLIGLTIWFAPHPEAISDQGWHVLAVFIATISGLILKPLPIAALAIISLSIITITGTLSIDEALSSYSRSSIWLIVIAFFISRGFIKTGLGKRIGYFFIRLFGKTSLGLAYSLTFSEVFLSAGIPSITARSGGIIFPIADAVSRSFGSEPNTASASKIGRFLILVCFQASIISSAMFITAMAANPVVADLARGMGVTISAGQWAISAILPAIVSIALIPLLTYTIAKPELEQLPHAVDFAKERLAEMGRMSRNEIVMLSTFVLLVTLWVIGGAFGIKATTTALLGVSILLIANVLTLDDLLSEKGAWSTFIWFGALIALASYLNTFGVIGYLSETIGGLVEGYSWYPSLLLLAFFYFFTHYFFASCMAHAGAMFAALFGIAVAVGAPPMQAALTLAFVTSLYGGITHYGIGNAPVLFGAGYVGIKDWWRVGLICGLVNMVIWLGIGHFWWPFLETKAFFGL